MAELRKLCKERGVSAGGKKAELVERLREANLAQKKGKADADAEPTSKRRKLPWDGKGAAGGAEGSGGGSGASGGGGGSGGGTTTTVVVGAALRQRKHMRTYLLDGDVGAKLPSVAASVALAQKRAAREGEAPKPRVMLPPIEKGSALVTVDAEAEMGAGASVYVDG